ncbi:ester cyclase [Pseudoroseomonas wenyumeiae]
MSPQTVNVTVSTTDIMRVVDGQIVEDWHVGDHEALHRQSR